jgi:hypothetical protein
MRKSALVGAVVAALTIGGTAMASDPISLPTGSEGCVSPAGDTCTYTTTRDAGYAARGTNWTLTIRIPANGDVRDTNLDGELRYVITPTNAPPAGCGFIAPGSTATTSAGADTVLAAGNPFPAASDAALGERNNCATGMVEAANPSYTPVD